MTAMTFSRPETVRGAFCILVVTVWLVLMPASEGLGENAGKGYYTVQVASYQKIDGATALITLLKARGYDSFARTVEIPGKGEWTRVCAGQYASREEALKAGEEMRSRGVIRHFLIVHSDPVHNESVKADPVKTDPVKIDPKGDAVKTASVETALRDDTGERAEPVTPPPVLLRKKISSAGAEPGGGEPHPPGDAVPPEGDMTAAGREGVLDRALHDFASGRYEEALHVFEKIIKTRRDETVLRRIADCHYFLGEKGDKGHLSEAIDYYREVIRGYPGLHQENARATYRLAESYRLLGLHYEALVEYKSVYLNYPPSDYTPESLYMTGRLSYETKRFDEAIERFKEYIARFPEGAHIREAYFGVGDCYSRLRQFNDADVWYDNALKKWPVLEDIPGDALLRLGSHYVQTGQYEDALGVLFVHLNLFPDSDHARDTLYAIARSFERTGQVAPALKMFSLIIERYPGSREAEESALMMANIGVDNPGMPVPAQIFAGMNYYAEPIEAYDAMRGTFSDPGMEEEALFRKEVALIKGNRYREAFDTGRLLLEGFPRGMRREEGEKNLVAAARNLIEGEYAEKDYVSVVDLYFDLDRSVLFKRGDFDMLYRIGRSLNEIRLLDQAAGFFEEMIRRFGKDEQGYRLSLEMAKVDCGRGKYEDAKERLQPLIEARAGVDDATAASARRLMGDILYEEGLYGEAAGVYAAILGPGTDAGEGAAVRKRYADSLREMGMYASALVNYRRVLDGCEGAAQLCPLPVVVHSYEGVGDCLYRKGQYQQAVQMYQQALSGVPEGERNWWTRINMDRGYAKLGKGPVTDESTGLPQGGAGDIFWSRVVDYYRTDEDWSVRYGPYIQGS
ncbi:MAG: tetratricopeptide repeat protein [Deltaproteobacteria bacterium]|nr:tetratricopeptide repeat protein [Deltaproteobacteria bacterium]